MKTSSRAYFLAGALLALGSLSAGLVHCAQLPEPQVVPADARCPVCGMYPARFGKWAAQLVLRDGSARFFDSPREFFVFQRDLARYGKGLQAGDIVAGFVTDYAGGGWVVAADAYFVRGSRLPGPMRTDALPAFASRAGAAAFVAEQGGELLTYSQLVDAMSASPAAGGADMHQHHH